MGTGPLPDHSSDYPLTPQAMDEAMGPLSTPSLGIVGETELSLNRANHG